MHLKNCASKKVKTANNLERMELYLATENNKKKICPLKHKARSMELDRRMSACTIT